MKRENPGREGQSGPDGPAIQPMNGDQAMTVSWKRQIGSAERGPAGDAYERQGVFQLTQARGKLCSPRSWGRLAELVEHLVYTERVGSSNLSPPTIFSPTSPA